MARTIPLRQISKLHGSQCRQGHLHRQQLGSIAICRIDCASVRLRSADTIALAKDLLILRQEKGTMRLVTGQEHSLLKPNDLAVIDCRHPLELHVDAPVSFTILQVLHDRSGADFSALANAGSTRIDSTQGSGAVASTFVEKFCEEGCNLHRDTLDPLIRSLVSVLDTAAFEAAGAARYSKHRSVSIRRIKRFISDNLCDSDLNPAIVAEQVGVSRRYLDELFKHESTTISRYIWSCRLEGCLRDLEDPRYALRRITEIAFSWGFNSASHFSRTFHERFNMSPSQARTLAITERAQLHIHETGAAAG